MLLERLVDKSLIERALEPWRDTAVVLERLVKDIGNFDDLAARAKGRLFEPRFSLSRGLSMHI